MDQADPVPVLDERPHVACDGVHLGGAGHLAADLHHDGLQGISYRRGAAGAGAEREDGAGAGAERGAGAEYLGAAPDGVE